MIDAGDDYLETLEGVRMLELFGSQALEPEHRQRVDDADRAAVAVAKELDIG
jgi:hypothetical protein